MEQLLQLFQKDLIMRIKTNLEILKESLKLMKNKVIVNLKKVNKMMNKVSDLVSAFLGFLLQIKVKKLIKNKK
jgi:hypothetical protein